MPKIETPVYIRGNKLKAPMFKEEDFEDDRPKKKEEKAKRGRPPKDKLDNHSSNIDNDKADIRGNDEASTETDTKGPYRLDDYKARAKEIREASKPAPSNNHRNTISGPPPSAAENTPGAGEDTPVNYQQRTTRWKRFRLRFAKNQLNAHLCNFELNNGKHVSIILFLKMGRFKWKGGLYFPDDEMKYEHLTTGLWAYDYHEGYSLPIKRLYDLPTVKEGQKLSNIQNIAFMTNPMVAEEYFNSKLAMMVLQGGVIGALWRQIRLLVIITLIIAFIHMMVFFSKAGIFAQMHIPGMG